MDFRLRRCCSCRYFLRIPKYGYNCSGRGACAAFHSRPTRRCLQGVCGKQQLGVRANHAQEVNLEGVFRPNDSASSVSKAPYVRKATIPIAVRCSNFGGNPAVSSADGQASPQGMAIKFHFPDGSDTHIVAHSYNGFPVATADELRESLVALGSSGPGVAKPTPFDLFLSSHPIAKTFLQIANSSSVSYATVSYLGPDGK